MKVHLDKIDNYDLDKIIQFIERVSTEENIWEKLTNKKILIKPNLLGPHTPDKAVTTNPVVLEAVIIVLQKRGFDIYLGDSPGGNISIDNLWKVTGIKDLVQKYNLKLIIFGEKGVVKIKSAEFDLVLDKQVMDFPAIINVAKYKTHSLTMFTGTVKNLFGVVPGLTKSDYHRLYPKPMDFSELLVRIYDELKDKIVLHLMDGIVGMEGEGPSSGTPKNFGVMFASLSGSGLDYIAAKMLGFKADAVPTIKMSMKNDGLSPQDIKIPSEWKDHVFHGTKIGKASISSALLNKLPSFMQKLFFQAFDYYPDFNNNCVMCLVCKEGCPVQAISFDEKMALKDELKKLTIDRKKCIKCMCCQEFCRYRAITLKKTLLAKLILRAKNKS